MLLVHILGVVLNIYRISIQYNVRPPTDFIFQLKICEMDAKVQSKLYAKKTTSTLSLRVHTATLHKL